MVQKKNMRKRTEYVSEPAEWSIKPKDATRKYMKRRVNALKSCYYCDIFWFINIYYDIVINNFLFQKLFLCIDPFAI